MMRKGSKHGGTGILGKKIGMTQIFDERGDVHPVTVLKAGPCVMTQLKTMAIDGYDAAQIGYVDFVKASKINKAMTGHFAKADVPPGHDALRKSRCEHHRGRRRQRPAIGLWSTSSKANALWT